MIKTSKKISSSDLRKKSGFQKHIVSQCYLLLIPEIVGLFLFTLYPMFWAAKKSWFYYTGIESMQKFIGWDNFIAVFKDVKYWSTWLTTLKFMFYKLPFELPLAMVIALILNKKLKGSGFFRSMYYLPNVISVAIIGLIFSNMFDYFGFVNAWLIKFGIIESEVSWMSTTYGAMTVLIIGAIWNTFGVNVMYFLAALSNVPEEMYEAAKLDGAGRFTVFFKITLPMMAPVLQTIILLALNGSLHTSDYILVTTNGAPGGTTFTVMSYIVNQFVPGFAANSVNIGYGCAMSLVTSFFMCLFAIFYMKLSKKMENVY